MTVSSHVSPNTNHSPTHSPTKNLSPNQAHERYKQKLMHSLLAEQFGFSHFRPGQNKLISAILDHRDMLGVLPTGAGKSLCYELPALMLPGLTIVITPLISLMQDQVRNLTRIGIPATFINSTLSYKRECEILSDTMHAKYRILYVAPERLETPLFRSFVHKVPVTIVAIDEAHCVSQWGQDFRPAYLRIPEFINTLAIRPVVAAFTATATVRTRSDIAQRLELHDPLTVTTIFDRPNLTWHVIKASSRRKRTQWIIDWARSHRTSSGIVYCSTRKAVDNLADSLLDAGVNARPYHAGHSGEERERNQADFLSGKVSVIVATNAFGMGINKPDVRWVIHNNAPQNIEEYYQEAGRAGRDGKPADCILLWMEGDFHTSRRFIDEAGANNDELDSADVRAIRRHLRDLLEAMHDYCSTSACLRNTILIYFGEHPTSPCGRCSNCAPDDLLTDLLPARSSSVGLSSVSSSSIGSLPTDSFPVIDEVEDDATNDELFQQLRRVRLKLAKKEHVPAFHIFPNKTLKNMVLARPKNMDELLKVKGVGPKTASKYGQAFLDILTNA